MAQRSHFFIISLLLLVVSVTALGQLNSPNADKSIKTEFGDSCYIFCSSRNVGNGSLTANAPMGVNSTFSWAKYDTISASFQYYSTSGLNDTLQSTIKNLEDGCYKVTITDGSTTFNYQAWILNNWIEVTNAEIPDSTSNCNEFKILADFEFAPLRVFDTQTNNAYSVRNEKFEFSWKYNNQVVSSKLSPLIFPPIASETPLKYDLEITDEFGCIGKGSADYYSKVPKSDFTLDPMNGEAVLEVTTTNLSINNDSSIWFFYKDNAQITREINAADGETVDSVDFILYDHAPIHEYEKSGEYRIKLVTVKVNETGNCYDTLYPSNYIEVLTSLVKVPNFFTPNNDGANDELVVQTQSLKSMTIKIYNRWGGLVHSWKYSNIRSSDYTYEYSVWDGRIGNRMATPGVYFYVVRAVGRDIDTEDNVGKEKTWNEEGFIHLFRDKQ